MMMMVTMIAVTLVLMSLKRGSVRVPVVLFACPLNNRVQIGRFSAETWALPQLVRAGKEAELKLANQTRPLPAITPRFVVH